MIVPGMKIAVLGCGVTGRAAARYALQIGAEVFISDNRDRERFVQEEAVLVADNRVMWEAGGHTENFLMQADLVLISPGISPQSPLPSRLQARGIPVTGELGVAAGKITKPVIAVTGTNGKTTVTTLIGRMLQAEGMNVFVGGNIGTPLYDYLTEPAGYDAVVAEVSSFQLATAGEFAPDVGVLLNITPDHIDWHGSLESYRNAKLELFTHQTGKNFAVVNGDDPLCCKLPDDLKSQLQRYGRAPGMQAIVGNAAVEINIGSEKMYFDLSGTVFAGEFGAANCSAAILAALDVGCSKEAIARAIADFSGLPHRLQLVAEKDGIRFFDDSKATNTGAVLGALQQFDTGVILIAGGRDKADDYTLLRRAVQEKVKHLVLIGEAAGLIAEALTGFAPMTMAESMKHAVSVALAHAQAGDVVLLSPACASFDMFRSYGHRGDVFREEVLAILASDREVYVS